jgi:hypothetical protein
MSLVTALAAARFQICFNCLLIAGESLFGLIIEERQNNNTILTLLPADVEDLTNGKRCQGEHHWPLFPVVPEPWMHMLPIPSKDIYHMSLSIQVFFA